MSLDTQLSFSFFFFVLNTNPLKFNTSPVLNLGVEKYFTEIEFSVMVIKRRFKKKKKKVTFSRHDTQNTFTEQLTFCK